MAGSVDTRFKSFYLHQIIFIDLLWSNGLDYSLKVLTKSSILDFCRLWFLPRPS